jgi:GT2 family glycosyltransferase
MLPDGWFYEQDIIAYRKLVNEIPDGGTICELGSWKGRSICSVSDLIRLKRLKVLIVDTFKGSENEGNAHIEAKDKDIRKQFEENVKKFNIEPIIYEMTTDEASEKINEHIDLVFIDADHSYEGVKNDIIKWKGKAKKLAGHDYGSWESVTKAVNESLKVKSLGTVWFEANEWVVCFIATKDRYTSTLPMTLTSVMNQTRKPDEIFIYDDSIYRIDMRNHPLLSGIIKGIEQKGILWKIVYGVGKGQHIGHQEINKIADLVWRIDDDEVAEPNVLETLLSELKERVGAVACSIIDPSQRVVGNSTGKISEINKEQNMQWICGSGEVEHLYSSFLYRGKIANYNLFLSPAAHREETMFSHELFRKGYKLIVTNKAKVWHFRNTTGGIRTASQNDFKHDEEIFFNYLENKNEDVFIIKEGLGDSIVFRKLLDDTGIKKPIFTAYKEVFEGYEVYTIEDAIKRGFILDDYSVYSFMNKQNWTGTLYDAYKKLYKI